MLETFRMAAGALGVAGVGAMAAHAAPLGPAPAGLTLAQFQKARADRLMRADTDHDGVLTEDERRAAQSRPGG